MYQNRHTFDVTFFLAPLTNGALDRVEGHIVISVATSVAFAKYSPLLLISSAGIDSGDMDASCSTISGLIYKEKVSSNDPELLVLLHLTQLRLFHAVAVAETTAQRIHKDKYKDLSSRQREPCTTRSQKLAAHRSS